MQFDSYLKFIVVKLFVSHADDDTKDSNPNEANIK